MTVAGASRVSVVARNGIPVARTLDELAATSDFDAFTVLSTGGTVDAAVTVAQMKAGLVPAGQEIHQPNASAPHTGEDINDHFNPPPDDEGYTAPGVHFDGSTYLSTASLTATDNDKLSWSGWFKIDPATENGTFAVVDPADTYTSNLNLYDDGEYAFNPCNSDGSRQLNVGDSHAGAIAHGVWHCIIFAAETNFDAGEKLAKVYVDDVALTPTVVDSAAAFSLVFNGLPFWFGSDTASGAGVTMDCADVRIMPGVSLLDGGDIPLATRRLFIDADGKPVDPATATAALGAAGAILFSGDHAGFATNQGTGGSFTLTGSLTNASTSPSD